MASRERFNLNAAREPDQHEKQTPVLELVARTLESATSAHAKSFGLGPSGDH
jgi:hypothetical protein